MAEKLISMKRPAQAANEAMKAAVSPDQPEYGWGLCLRLENFELDKLGIKQLPRVGQEVGIVARGTITSVSQNENERSEDGPDRGVQIQITDLAVGKPAGDKE